MEFTLPDKSKEFPKVIVLAGTSGDASVYFESNNAQKLGGFIGGIAHQHIAKDATSMVILASEKIALMQQTEKFPHVAPNNVRFIVATKQGRYTAEVSEEEIKKESNPFFWIIFGRTANYNRLPNADTRKTKENFLNGINLPLSLVTQAFPRW